jgi:hypothetical protein
MTNRMRPTRRAFSLGSRIRLIFPFSSDFAVGDFCSVVDCVLCAIDKAAQPAYSTIPKRGRNFML